MVKVEHSSTWTGGWRTENELWRTLDRSDLRVKSDRSEKGRASESFASMRHELRTGANDFAERVCPDATLIVQHQAPPPLSHLPIPNCLNTTITPTNKSPITILTSTFPRTRILNTSSPLAFLLSIAFFPEESPTVCVVFHLPWSSGRFTGVG